MPFHDRNEDAAFFTTSTATENGSVTVGDRIIHRGDELFIRQGEEAVIEVSLEKQAQLVVKNSRTKKAADLPAKFKNQPIFFFVVMSNTGDSVTVNK